jgi:hypothetical protein
MNRKYRENIRKCRNKWFTGNLNGDVKYITQSLSIKTKLKTQIYK